MQVVDVSARVGHIRSSLTVYRGTYSHWLEVAGVVINWPLALTNYVTFAWRQTRIPALTGIPPAMSMNLSMLK